MTDLKEISSDCIQLTLAYNELVHKYNEMYQKCQAFEPELTKAKSLLMVALDEKEHLDYCVKHQGLEFVDRQGNISPTGEYLQFVRHNSIERKKITSIVKTTGTTVAGFNIDRFTICCEFKNKIELNFVKKHDGWMGNGEIKNRGFFKDTSLIWYSHSHGSPQERYNMLNTHPMLSQ